MTLSAEFEAHTADDAKKQALTIYNNFVGREVSELPYSAVLHVSDGVAKFSVMVE